MNNVLSTNTQAILLLTAPLIIGRGQYSSELLTSAEYNRLARMLRDNKREPCDLLGPQAEELFQILQSVVDSGRLVRLLGRGLVLSQAIEHWQTRSIWVVSRADLDYPGRLKERLKESAPPVLYGSGDDVILQTGGLAVVGSRNVDDKLIEYAEKIGRLAAKAQQTIVSGGARGIDRAAMFGALQTGGRVISVVADSLERLVLSRDCREYLMDKKLVLISPYDPLAGFDVGHAMQRNKLIYALADAALVVNSDFKKGGTWSGAVEQLEKLHLVPVYVRIDQNNGSSLKALQQKGALPWPEPQDTQELINTINIKPQISEKNSLQNELPLYLPNGPSIPARSIVIQEHVSEEMAGYFVTSAPSISLADELFSKVKELIIKMQMPVTDVDVAGTLRVSKKQAKEWLDRLVKEESLVYKRKPSRYLLPLEKQNTFFNISK